MTRGPDALWEKSGAWLDSRGILGQEQGACRKWLRFYLDFCHKYGLP